MLPVSCWEQIAQAAGAVFSSRLTCTASWLATAQQYGTRVRHDAEIEFSRYAEEHPFRGGWAANLVFELLCETGRREEFRREMRPLWLESPRPLSNATSTKPS